MSDVPTVLLCLDLLEFDMTVQSGMFPINFKLF